MTSRREIWDARYGSEREGEPQAAAVLRQHAYLLPTQGTALDAACGLGGNALLLSRRGLRVSAWDISARAIETLQATATRHRLDLQAEVRDVEAAPPAPRSYDVITVSRFLVRGLCPHLRNALRPRGLLYYQTFVRAKVAEVGPSNPEYLLADNELLSLFAGMRVLVYRDEGVQGDPSHGVRNEAWLVAQQPDEESA